MRKVSVFVLITVLVVSMIGCSQETDNTGVDEQPTLPSSFSEGESSQTPEPSEQPTETVEPETTAAPASESEQSATAATDDKKQQSGNQASDGQSQTPQTKPPAEAPKPTQPPVSAEPPKTEPPATPTPAPTEPPKPQTAYDAPYDTAVIIADAKAYGESIGMTWSEPLTIDNCSWEAPSETSPVMSGERLKEAIESGIRRVKKLQLDNEYQPGEFHFKLLLVPSGSEYTIYWLIG